MKVNSASSFGEITSDFAFGEFSKIIPKSLIIIIYFIHLIYFNIYQKIYIKICIHSKILFIFYKLKRKNDPKSK